MLQSFQKSCLMALAPQARIDLAPHPATLHRAAPPSAAPPTHPTLTHTPSTAYFFAKYFIAKYLERAAPPLAQVPLRRAAPTPARPAPRHVAPRHTAQRRIPTSARTPVLRYAAARAGPSHVQGREGGEGGISIQICRSNSGFGIRVPEFRMG